MEDLGERRHWVAHLKLKVEGGPSSELWLGKGLNFLPKATVDLWFSFLTFLRGLAEGNFSGSPLEGRRCEALVAWDDLEYHLRFSLGGKGIAVETETLELEGVKVFEHEAPRFDQRYGEFVFECEMEGEPRVERLPEPYPLALHPLFKARSEPFVVLIKRIRAWELCDCSDRGILEKIFSEGFKERGEIFKKIEAAAGLPARLWSQEVLSGALAVVAISVAKNFLFLNPKREPPSRLKALAVKEAQRKAALGAQILMPQWKN